MPKQNSIYALSTPAVLIDENIVEKNIARVQKYLDQAGLETRPHIKTHKIPAFAQKQIDAGAIGITCQKISEAETFADAGFDDILITYNIMGAEKLVALKALNNRIKLGVVADNQYTVDGLAEHMDEPRPLRVLVECDTGAKRCGVQSPQEAAALARYIASKPNLHFAGLMTYPKPDSEEQVDAFFGQTAELLAKENIHCEIFSTGGSPSLFSAEKYKLSTEYRAGTCIYNDRSLVRAGHCGFDDCAMHILASVVSRPTENRAVLDAGSKALTSDLSGFGDFGHIVDYPDAVITELSEEHAVVDLSACAKKPAIGEKIRIIPNHTCVVSILMDVVYIHRAGHFDRKLEVAARGRVW